MSWHCLPGLAAGFSGECSSGGAAFARSRSTPMPGACCLPASATGHLLRSLFGTTCALSTGAPGGALSTSSAAVSPAPTSASPARAPASTARSRASGGRWRASLARYDPATCSWRTAQPSLFGASEECSVTWPPSGMTAGGTCWALPTSAPPIFEGGCGLLPTIRSTDGERGGRGDLIQALRGNPNSHYRSTWVPTPTCGDAKASGSRNTAGSKAHPGVSLSDWVRGDGGQGRTMLPTPTANSYGSCQGGSAGREGQRARPSLQSMAATGMWPTPNVPNGGRIRKSQPDGVKRQHSFETAVRMWPTPAARDYRHPNAKTYQERGGGSKGEQLPNAVGGPLNPPWVEWLIGWPIGWTACEPLETDRFRQWLEQHGKY